MKPNCELATASRAESFQSTASAMAWSSKLESDHDERMAIWASTEGR